MDARFSLAVRAGCLAAVVVVGGVAGAPALARSQASGAPQYVQTALKQLAKLSVKAPGSMSGYSRDRFGPAWADVDGNRCDTRDDILRRDLTKIVLKPGSTCIIASGTLHDPYTGKTIKFVRGVGTSANVQIDHVVALADAWRTGAAAWTANLRLQYANSRLVLLAVDGSANEAKGDEDAAEWLPPRVKFRCRYVARQISVKTHYHLWVTTPERAALVRVLDTCS